MSNGGLQLESCLYLLVAHQRLLITITKLNAQQDIPKIRKYLEEKRPKIILLDEMDKMPKQFQNQLLGFMESGRVDLEQQRKQYHFKIEGAKVFATCNEINRLSKALQSRFRKLFLPRYLEQQFVMAEIYVM